MAGEAPTAEMVKRWGEKRRFINAYGPTETSVCATTHECATTEGGNPPIGRPIANTQIYILDANLEPAPIGVAGEIYIGGAGVARGYLNRPELTAERFVKDPFAKDPEARMYKTGDLGRWRADGAIDFLGRNDFQVKIRGFRIELGEIEARLRAHPSIHDAVVVAREDVPGDKRLAAYYVGGADLDARALRAHVTETLPEYMAPSAFMRLEALPLTPNGKLDRNALPAPEGEAFGARDYEAPVTNMEQMLADIWAEVLKVERVGRRDNFFDLGGHSLLAVQVVSRIRQGLGLEAKLADVFARPVLADCAALLDEAAGASLAPIPSVERTKPIALSFAQQRLWFLAQLEGASEAYHISLNLKLTGELDREALRCALDRIVGRHEGLRTTFETGGGEPFQRIAPADVGFALAYRDVRGRPDGEVELDRLAGEEASAPFDLARGPLIRGLLVQEAADEHTLFITMHHIVGDGWSIAVFMEELKALYSAFLKGQPDPLPGLPVQYAEFAAWERATVANTKLAQEQAAYWKKALAGAPALLEIPADRPRPAQQDYAGDAADLVLDEELTRRLRALSKRHGVTLYVTFLAAWAALLARLSGQEDLVIGSPAANRSRAEFEPLIGFFVNTLPIRVDLSGSVTVSELLARVKTQTLAAQQHQDLPFEQVVEAVQPKRSLAYSPLFQVMLAWQNTPSAAFELPGLRGASIPAPHTTAQFDLVLYLDDIGGSVTGRLEYATSLFERGTIERYLSYWKSLLDAMAADDGLPVGRLPLLPEAERATVLVDWNATEADYPKDTCIHELFEAQAARTPDAVAVVHGDVELTYAELNAKANRLAHYLRGLGVTPDARVAICVERSLDMVVGLLAILKAGGAYVPLDPAYPADRLAFMLKDSAPVALLTRAKVKEALSESLSGMAAIALEADAELWAREPASNPAGGAEPKTLAYVIYTSGSTGVPKGVMVEHGGVMNLLWSMRELLAFEASDRFVLQTTIAFDIAGLELYLPLICGARTILADQKTGLDPALLSETLVRHEATFLQATPSTWGMLMEAGCEGLRGIKAICGGEALPQDLANQLMQQARNLWNVYGPTETTIWSSALAVEAGAIAPGRLSIGRPIANTQIYILDANLEPAPIGVAGEIYIGGAGVARGYLNRPELTAERFVKDPFAKAPEARMYKTGDLGRWRADGAIDFLGRNDFQVKIRGFRIELGEIEARLRAHPSIHDAVVVAREDVPGDKRLAAYYVGGAGLDARALRAHVTETLPEYMAPSAFMRLEALPLTPNGKLDRNALPAPEGEAFGARDYEAPVTNMEQMLADIWAEVLKVERVGRRDNFFDLGGHSLTAVRLLGRIEEEFGRRYDLSLLFKAPTIGDFVKEIGKIQQSESFSPNVIFIQSKGSRAPIFAINTPSMWYKLSRHLGEEQPVIGLQLLNILDDAELSRDSFGDIADKYVELIRQVQSKGPYAIMGWCVGGALAFEAARRLSEAGEEISFVGVVSGQAPGFTRRLGILKAGLVQCSESWHEITRGSSNQQVVVQVAKKFAARLRAALTRTHAEPHPSDSAQNPQLLAEKLRQLAECHKLQPFSGRITVFSPSLEPKSIFHDPTLGWKAFCQKGVDVVDVSGDHDSVFKDPGAIEIASHIILAQKAYALARN